MFDKLLYTILKKYIFFLIFLLGCMKMGTGTQTDMGTETETENGNYMKFRNGFDCWDVIKYSNGDISGTVNINY